MSVRTETAMGTLVTIEVVGGDAGAGQTVVNQALTRAFGWFHEIEERCTRFNAQSELMQLCTRVGERTPVSAILFEAVRFAVMVAEETGGAFDPTVGDPTVGHAMYRDVDLDADERTITLRCALTLDLGAVAKGLAVDAAARELAPWRDYAINAGGDLYLGGRNARGEAWAVGISHPRRDGELIDRLSAQDQAVCTSGDYERGQHILDPRCGAPAQSVASATVVAQSAMLADALATAAFVLGPEQGIALLERMGVDGLIFTPELARYETRGLRHAA